MFDTVDRGDNAWARQIDNEEAVLRFEKIEKVVLQAAPCTLRCTTSSPGWPTVSSRHCAWGAPDPFRSVRLFAALLKGFDLLIIARFDEARAEDDNEIESYCRSTVAMFIAAQGGNDHADE